MQDRLRMLNSQPVRPGPVLYWMNRDQRAEDNWALVFAVSEARRQGQPLLVVFCLQHAFLGATPRHYAFMLAGIAETARSLERQGILFLLTQGDPVERIPDLARQLTAGLVVCDFSPLRLPRTWRDTVAPACAESGIAVAEVDAHNIIPVWQASRKQAFAARTLRPYIHRLLPHYLTDFPPAIRPGDLTAFSASQLDQIAGFGPLGLAAADAATEFAPQADPFLPTGGYAAAAARLDDFLANELSHYSLRNDPNQPVTSQLSPYLHFGQISAQRVALQTLANEPAALRPAELVLGTALPIAPRTSAAAEFLEELIVRRELADNYCLYNLDYDRFAGFPDWARKTLDQHRSDPRPYRYSEEQLELGQTHDELWNAAQRDLCLTGSMPGYLRMYWAKKLLEWTPDPESAQQLAVAFNDGYALDGRDPNGYTGIAWSIGGVHDRPWGERPIFGMVRFMSYAGSKRKFSIPDYVRSVQRKVALSTGQDFSQMDGLR